MPDLPDQFNHLTAEQAWGFTKGDVLLDDLSKEAKLELGGLSTFGQSEKHRQFLWQSVDPITEGARRATTDPKHVRAGLIRLGVREP